MDDNVELLRDDESQGKWKRMTSWIPYVPRRYILTGLLFLGTANSFALRVNMNVAIVAMVNDTQDQDVNSTVQQCPGPSNFGNRTEKSGEFQWSPTIQSILLASFYYGYPVLQPIGGYMSHRFGSKWLIASTGFIAGIINVLQPTFAHLSPYAMIFMRVMLGLCQGALWPSLATMLSKWTPETERARLFAMVNAGVFVGTIVSQSISGVLCDSSFLGGWPSVFYVFGAFSITWSIAFMVFTSDSPLTHPSISKEEKALIMAKVGDTKYRKPPWKKILTSRAFYSFAFMLFMDITSQDVIITFIPLYMKRVLKYDISESGALASVPYVTSFFMTFLAGYTSDVIRNKKLLSTMWIRRIYTIMGECLPALTFVVMSTFGCNRVVVVLCFIVGVSLQGLSNGGFNVNMFDFAPRYAGAMYGVANGFGNTGGFIGPIIVNAFTSESADMNSWKAVFYLVAGGYGLGTLVFCLFGSGDIQPWNDDTEDSDTEHTSPRPDPSQVQIPHL